MHDLIPVFVILPNLVTSFNLFIGWANYGWKSKKRKMFFRWWLGVLSCTLLALVSNLIYHNPEITMSLLHMPLIKFALNGIVIGFISVLIAACGYGIVRLIVAMHSYWIEVVETNRKQALAALVHDVEESACEIKRIHAIAALKTAREITKPGTQLASR